MLPEYDFSFQPYPRHDAHVKEYYQDFLNQLTFSTSNIKVHDSFCIDRANVYGGYYTRSSLYYIYELEPVVKETNADQTYKKRKHIPNNQEEQKARKAKLLAKNKFFK